MTQAVSGRTVPAPIAQLIQTELAPQVQAIDREGLYPEQFMRKLGALGGFSSALPPESGGSGAGLAAQIGITAAVAEQCGSTAFLVWCQSSCAWYLQNSDNQAVRDLYLNDVAQGRLLAGTGMSNAVKHLAGIEKIHLRARREGDGYVVNGSLPWVSNVGNGHLAIVAAAVEDEGYIMFATPSSAQGFESRACLEFSGLEGTQTLNLRFQNVSVSAENVLAHPDQFKQYIRRIKPGFVLGQIGMGMGIVQACLGIMRDSNGSVGHVNAFLDDQEPELVQLLADVQAQVDTQAPSAQTGSADMLQVLKARAAISELTLKAANSAVLHAGAKGYLMIHPAQRRLREAVFVAIVTPALKHLRKEIRDLEARAQSDTLHTEAA
ncbi:MAG TPA: acyl-CoA dehydrogenase family protein [Pusillimonas sp.]|uniref:acyl-CoA dehydrogenase family protein n=1 Tax=Pusillimonas sp. TaxID=3040095 RepID=UPI002C2C8503|nr:acyl-CoA dehydrogenase family protein [Pusillimonas sp.]HUH86933.1 acyl-CoA dehydrogenase family protein [Pusillimonas sp.]